MNPKTVAVMTLGGTIACVPDEEGGVSPSADPQFMATVIADAVRGSIGLPETRLVMGASVASSALDSVVLSDLIGQFERLVDEGSCGVVVTTGTDSIEEVAFLLDLLWRRDEPIVVCGAMRHGGLPGGDGPANVRDGLRVAAHEQTRGMGCLVVMNGHVHQAWQVRKSHTGSLSAFESAVSGPTGSIFEETLRLTSGTVMDRPLFTLGASTPIPAVALVKASLADDGRLLTVVDPIGYRGLVVEAMGGGSVPPSWVPELARLTAKMPVVYTSRAFAGPTLRSTYGSFGSERHLRRIGLTPAGLLDGLKARLLVSLLLACGADEPTMGAVWRMFDTPTYQRRRPELTAAPVMRGH